MRKADKRSAPRTYNQREVGQAVSPASSSKFRKSIDPWAIDLEPFGVVVWRESPDLSEARPAYSDELVALPGMAAAIAHREGSKLGIPHVLACYSPSQHWRDGRTPARVRDHQRVVARQDAAPVSTSAPSPLPAGRPYFTPEEAAAYLGVHIQTMRGYIRLRREDLDALLEPLQAQEIEKEN